MIVISIATVFISQRLAREEALEDAQARAGGIARGVADLVTGPLKAGDEQAVARVSSIMEPRLRGGALTHVKLWAPDGTIIWADEPSLIGRQFPLEADVTSLFGTSDVTAELSNLDKPENAEERLEGELLEVYVGAYDSTGRPMVFEAYLPTEGMEEKEKELINHLPEGLADADAVPGPHNARKDRLRRVRRARAVSTTVDIAWSGGFAPHGQPTDSFSPLLNAPCGVQ